MNEKIQKNLLVVISVFVICVAIFIIYKKLKTQAPPLLPPPPPLIKDIPRKEIKYADEGKIIKLNILKEPYNIKIKNAQGKVYTAVVDDGSFIGTKEFAGQGIKGLAYLSIGDEVIFQAQQDINQASQFHLSSVSIKGAVIPPSQYFTIYGTINAVSDKSFLFTSEFNKKYTVLFDKKTLYFGGELKEGSKAIIEPQDSVIKEESFYATKIRVL